jgi:hypothetical protein
MWEIQGAWGIQRACVQKIFTSFGVMIQGVVAKISSDLSEIIHGVKRKHLLDNDFATYCIVLDINGGNLKQMYGYPENGC